MVSSQSWASWLSGNPPPMPQDFLELGDVIAGKEEPRRFPSETLVFELASPYMWDVPILEWIRAWAAKQGLGTDFDFSA
jgi:alanine dehydrogenase